MLTRRFPIAVSCMLLLLGGVRSQEPATPADDWEGMLRRASTLFSQGQASEATQLARDALALAESALEPDDERLLAPLLTLSSLLIVQGDSKSAEPLAVRAHELSEAKLVRMRTHVATSLKFLGAIYLQGERLDEAQDVYERAVSLSEEAVGPDHPETAKHLGNLAAIQLRRERHDEAEAILERSLAIWAEQPTPDPVYTAGDLCNLAQLRLAQGRPDEAVTLVTDAVEMQARVFGADDPRLQNTRRRYEEVLQQARRDGAASEPFERVLGGAGLDRGVDVRPLRDGGYAVVGVTTSSGAGGEDVWLVRTDAKGEPLWSKTYGGAASDNGWAVLETTDGFALGGFTDSSGAGGFDFLLVRTDATGEERWSKTYGGRGDDRCWALHPTSDGGYLLAGETNGRGAGEEDFFVVKTDAEGTEEWSRTYGGAKGDRCFSIAAADDGGYVLAGQTYSEGAGERDARVVKISASGDEVWSRTLGGPARDVAHCVTRTRDGNYLVTGYTASFGASGYDPYLILFDEAGEVAWTRVLSLPGVHRTLTGTEASGGGFFLVGLHEDPTTRAKSALVVRTDEAGEVRWTQDVRSTRVGESFGYTVRATRDGGCVFTGHSTVGSEGGRDLLLVKVADR